MQLIAGYAKTVPKRESPETPSEAPESILGGTRYLGIKIKRSWEIGFFCKVGTVIATRAIPLLRGLKIISLGGLQSTAITSIKGLYVNQLTE